MTYYKKRGVEFMFKARFGAGVTESILYFNDWMKEVNNIWNSF